MLHDLLYSYSHECCAMKTSITLRAYLMIKITSIARWRINRFPIRSNCSLILNPHLIAQGGIHEPQVHKEFVTSLNQLHTKFETLPNNQLYRYCASILRNNWISDNPYSLKSISPKISPHILYLCCCQKPFRCIRILLLSQCFSQLFNRLLHK